MCHFVLFSHACSAFRLIGIGMGTWALATFGCGLAVGFKSLIFCRMLVGVGEASFVALAAPFIGERCKAVRLLAAVYNYV
jgi:MFS family permease